MSLRGSETTEAIPEVNELAEIATLPRIESGVARNDQKGIAIQPLGKEGAMGIYSGMQSTALNFVSNMLAA
jgi:hypothetical protein